MNGFGINRLHIKVKRSPRKDSSNHRPRKLLYEKKAGGCKKEEVKYIYGLTDKDMFDLFNAEPLFEEFNDGFKSTMFRKPTKRTKPNQPIELNEKNNDNDGVENKIVALLRQQPDITTKEIAKGIASGIASGICGIAAAGITVLIWAVDPGGSLASFIDKRDSTGANDWCTIG